MSGILVHTPKKGIWAGKRVEVGVSKHRRAKLWTEESLLHPSTSSGSIEQEPGLGSKGPPASKLFRHLIPAATRSRFIWTEKLSGGARELSMHLQSFKLQLTLLSLRDGLEAEALGGFDPDVFISPEAPGLALFCRCWV